jgi:hypothetical protein
MHCGQQPPLHISLRAAIVTLLNANVYADDVTLRRFLRARKHDVPKAKAMVLNALKWRREFGTDTIIEDFEFTEKDHFFRYYPEGFYCTDRAGRPVYVQQPGCCDIPKLFEETTLERCLKYHVQKQVWKLVGSFLHACLVTVFMSLHPPLGMH